MIFKSLWDRQRGANAKSYVVAKAHLHMRVEQDLCAYLRSLQCSQIELETHLLQRQKVAMLRIQRIDRTPLRFPLAERCNDTQSLTKRTLYVLVYPFAGSSGANNAKGIISCNAAVSGGATSSSATSDLFLDTLFDLDRVRINGIGASSVSAAAAAMAAASVGSGGCGSV